MRTIRFTAAPDLAAEMPRFFDGKLETCLAEAFQNSFRASASHLIVTYELQTRKLVIEDDGAGIADPSVLLDAGRTTWNPEKVIEPAGCGFFALLDERLFESITVSSIDWQFSITPEDRAHLREVQCTDVQRQLGTRIELRLARRWSLDEIKQAIETARAYYPVVLFFNGMDIPAKKLEGEIHVNIPGIGDVYWQSWYGWKHSENVEAIWACKNLGHQNLEPALEAAAKVANQPEIARVLLTGKLRWQVDPACGARPVLPQRDRMADSEALHQAAVAILNALTAQVVQVGAQSITGWPDQLSGGFTPEPAWLGGFVGPLAKYAGWRYVCWTDLSQGLNLYDDDGLRVECNRAVAYWHRHAVSVASRSVAQTLNQLELGHFCANELGIQPQVTFKNLRVDPTLNLFALAENITVRIGDKEYQVPFLLPQEGLEEFWDDELHEPLKGGVGFVFAGDAGSLAETLHNHDWRSDTLMVAAALWVHHVSEQDMTLWDMVEHDDGTAYSLKYGDIARHIESLAFEKFDKDRLATQLQYRARWDVLDAILDWLEKVNCQRKHWCSGMTAEQLRTLDDSATMLRMLAMRLRDDVDHDAGLLALPLFNDWRLQQCEDDLTGPNPQHDMA